MLPYLYIGTYSVPSYGLCMAAGIVVACMIAFFRLRTRGGSFDPLLLIAATGLAIGLCCARISYYIFSYGIGRLFREIFSGDFSGFSNFGLVYYGGLIGGIAGGMITAKLNKYDFDVYANAIVPCIPLGHAFGRIGCLFAGCCYGLPYEGIFAVHSMYVDPQELLFPIQAIESILNITVFVFLVVYTRRQKSGFVTLAIYLMSYSAIRFILEFFRGDLIRGLHWGLSTSQWISILLLISCSVLIVFHKKQAQGKPIVSG